MNNNNKKNQDQRQRFILNSALLQTADIFLEVSKIVQVSVVCLGFF